MKVIAYSAWVKPEIYTVKNSRDAKRLARRIKNEEQKKCEIFTEYDYREYILLNNS